MATERQSVRLRGLCTSRPGIYPRVTQTGTFVTPHIARVPRKVIPTHAVIKEDGYTIIMMDHDRLFKELLTTFFAEFVEAFLPDVAAYLDASSIEFLDKEIFTDVTAGEKHEVDIVVKARFRGQDAFFLIHVENQSSAQSDFPKRMFRYFARLLEKYDLPIYPVVIFSYEEPKRPEPTHYTVAFPGRTVLQFQYRVIQLNRLAWRSFLTRPNPVATALMTRMKIAPRDRVKVRGECMRLLTTLRLDPARSQLIGGFIETYLKLTAAEMRRYERRFAQLPPQEQEATMEMWTSIGREGQQKGRHEGKEELVARLITRRFGSVSEETTKRLDQLSSDQLNELGVALFDFASAADLEDWLSRNN